MVAGRDSYLWRKQAWPAGSFEEARRRILAVEQKGFYSSGTQAKGRGAQMYTLKEWRPLLSLKNEGPNRISSHTTNCQPMVRGIVKSYKFAPTKLPIRFP